MPAIGHFYTGQAYGCDILVRPRKADRTLRRIRDRRVFTKPGVYVDYAGDGLRGVDGTQDSPIVKSAYRFHNGSTHRVCIVV